MMSIDDISVGSSSTNSTSSTAAVATPLRKYRKDNNNPSKSTIASPEQSLASPSGAATVSTILSNGGSILEQKRLRKRMALMELERNRGLNTSLNLTSSSERGVRSFDMSSSSLSQPVISSGATSFNPNSCFESDVEESVASDMATRKPSNNVESDRVSEMRRRRLYETHHRQPYSQSKPKKKFKFWEQDKPTPFHMQPQQLHLMKQNPQQQCVNNFNGLLKQSASFSDYERYRDPSTPHDDSMEYSFRTTQHEFDVNWIHPMNKLRAAHTADEDDCDEDEPSYISSKASPRVLWNETTNLQTQMEALALGQLHQDNGAEGKSGDGRDEIMGGLVYEDDEIMTPIKDRKYVSVPNHVSADEANACVDASGLVSPDASAMITPLLEAVTFETPEKVAAPIIATSTAAIQNSMLACMNDEDAIAEITPTNSADEAVLSPPNAPKKERIHKTPSPEEEGELSIKVDRSAATPATVGTAATMSSTPASDIVPMDQSGDATMMPMKAVKLSVNPASGIIQWQSLYRDGKGDFSVTKSPEKNPTKVASLQEVTSIIQALSEEQPQSLDGADGSSTNNNMLKLFTHLYQQSTYGEIVKSIPEIKDQSALVIARGLDFSASTYHTAAEVKALLEALKNIDKLDSIMLLNFRPESMVDLAKTLNQHPSMYRLQIHLAEGSINGELLGVMATAPRLTHLQLDLKESCAIGTLTNSKSLQTLRVTTENITLDKAHLRTLIYGLGSNNTLTTLDLAPEMSIEHFRSMCSALRENNRLESLRVSLKLTTEADSQVAAMELANLLKKNRAIVSVWNHAHEESSPPSVVGKRILQEALKKNGTVKEIKFFSEDLDDSFFAAENPENFVLGIQPRQQDVIFNHFEEQPSTICSTSYTSYGNDSYSKDAECDVVPSVEFCGMLHNVSNSLKDCVWPDVSSVIGDWKERENNNRKKNQASTSVSVL